VPVLDFASSSFLFSSLSVKSMPKDLPHPAISFFYPHLPSHFLLCLMSTHLPSFL
jgi:hypothetical protein